jgi:hypothetical protein
VEDFLVLVSLVLLVLLRAVGHSHAWVGSLDVHIQNGWARLGIRRLLGRFPQALCPAAATTRKAGLDASRAAREALE